MQYMDILPRCDLCVMHMPAGRIIRQSNTARCNRNTQMRWRQMDVAIADRCLETTFILTGEEEMEPIKGVGGFKYLGRLMDRSDEKFTEVLRNTRKARQMWGQIGKILWREGAKTTFSDFFNRTVVHAVLLFGEEE